MAKQLYRIEELQVSLFYLIDYCSLSFSNILYVIDHWLDALYPFSIKRYFIALLVTLVCLSGLKCATGLAIIIILHYDLSDFKQRGDLLTAIYVFLLYSNQICYFLARSGKCLWQVECHRLCSSHIRIHYSIRNNILRPVEISCFPHPPK